MFKSIHQCSTCHGRYYTGEYSTCHREEDRGWITKSNITSRISDGLYRNHPLRLALQGYVVSDDFIYNHQEIVRTFMPNW